MRLRIIYLILCVLGTVLPYSALLLFLLDNGLDIPLALDQLLENNISIFGWLDVIVSAIVLIVFAFAEGQRLKMPYWWVPIIATFAVGVSLGLPLFLYLREVQLESVRPE
ncbi:MAG: DUF2834 domain-containing protein [Candidatus Hodarchaeota archaeon]